MFMLRGTSTGPWMHKMVLLWSDCSEGMYVLGFYIWLKKMRFVILLQKVIVFSYWKIEIIEPIFTYKHFKILSKLVVKG